MAKNKNKKQTAYPAAARLNYPEYEKAISWLSMLFDAYFSADQGIFESIEAELMKGRSLACAKGCSACCKTHVTIPVYPLELMGIYWYLSEMTHHDSHEAIIEQLLDFAPGKGCPFLIEGACGIHPIRPLACRFFNVFSKPCGEGEDPYYTRRKDVWTPDEKIKDKALSKMLPHYGIVQRAEKREAMKNGYMLRFVKNMQDIHWPNIAIRLNNRDSSPIGEKGFLL